VGSGKKRLKTFSKNGMGLQPKSVSTSVEKARGEQGNAREKKNSPEGNSREVGKKMNTVFRKDDYEKKPSHVRRREQMPVRKDD